MKIYPKGPWKAGYSDGSGPDTVIGDDKCKAGIRTIAVARVRWGCGCCEDTSPLEDWEKLNAALIAAIPDMLSVVENVIHDAKQEGHLSVYTIKTAKSIMKKLKKLE